MGRVCIALARQQAGAQGVQRGQLQAQTLWLAACDQRGALCRLQLGFSSLPSRQQQLAGPQQAIRAKYSRHDEGGFDCGIGRDAVAPAQRLRTVALAR
jgi:hypothetical protein